MRNAQGMVEVMGRPECRVPLLERITRTLGVLVLGLCGLTLGGAASAETFNALPTRVIGPFPGQVTPAPGGGWQAADNATIGASIGGQGGWSVSCNAAKYDQEITTAVARSGQQAWRLSNWFHEGCVNTVLSPAFASVQEGVGPSSHITYSFWFMVPSGNDGLTVSSSLTDAPGARLTYAAIRDVGGSAHVQVVGILQGSGFINTLPAPFDDAGVEYDIRTSPSLMRDAWYRLTVEGTLVSGSRNDDITYTIHDAAGAPVWSSGVMDSWEDAYLAGPFAPPGTKVTVTRLGWRIVENPDDPLNRNPFGTYALNRPAGVFVDDLAIAPGSGSGLSTGFESDRYVATTGSNVGNCANPLAPCMTIGYAVAQAAAYNTIHIASGRYEESVTIPATLDGLVLKGEGATRPELAIDTGAIDQRLITVVGAEDVRIEGLAFAMDQSFVAEGILAMGTVDGLELVDNAFVASHSVPAQTSTFGRRNAIAINLVPNTAGLPRVDGSFVSILGNTVDGATGATLLRSGISMDAGVGLIQGNTIAAGTQDITVRFCGALPATPVKTVRIEGNTLSGRGLQIANPNATCQGVEVVDNDIIVGAAIGAFALDDTTVLPADWNLVRLIHNSSNVPTLLHDNRFGGHRGHFRGVTVQNYRNVTLTDNVFTPAAGAADFVSLVLSNKELTGDAPIVPNAVAITALGNAFNGNGSGVAGRAVEFINDNDANGAATFGPLQFGAVGGENTFDPDLRWYFTLNGNICDTRVPPGIAPECTFLNYNAVGSLQNTQVRPFRGNVDAVNNLFDGDLPAAMTPAERNALLARTRDDASNADLGVVDYGFTATQPATYVDAAFAGAYGDALTFTHDGVTPGPVYFGIDAFATINDGIMHVADGGPVYVADGTYAETVAINKPLQLIGNGIDNTTVISGSLNITASGVPGTPILFQDFIVTNPAGSALTLGGTVSHLRFEGVAFDDSSASAVRFNGTGNDHIAFVGPGCRFRDNMFGVVTASAAVARDVSFVDCDFLGNEAGIVLFGGDSVPSLTGLVQDWSITGSTFLGNNDDSSIWGGGLWLKTGGAGTTINGFTVTGSTFSDNGSTNPLNRTGITVRARTGATMAGVQICNNSFKETGAAGTQLTGINVYAQPGSVYTPIEVCSNNAFSGLGHSVSGLEQFTATATEPVVNITGGMLLGWEHLYFAPAATVYVDDDFAGTLNGDAVDFAGHAPAACAAATGRIYGVDAFASISQALLNVQSGGTVCVAAGDYIEPTLDITAPVSLFGAQATLPAPNRADTGASIVYPAVGNPALSYAGPEALSLVNVESSDVVIDGFVFDGDNTAITSPLAMGAANPDVDSGIWAFGDRIRIRNNVVRNLVYAGIEGYNFTASHPAREGNAIQHNWIHNIDAPSDWGIGIVLLWNYYADVSDNLLTDVRVGIQTNYFFKTAPVPGDAVISNNEIRTSRLGIYHNFHNAATSQASPFTLAGNTIHATENAVAIGPWTGIVLQTLQAASTAVVTGNIIDASLTPVGRLRLGYTVSSITTSLASSTAISGGDVNAVDYGVLVTDGAYYGGPTDDIVVQGVDFSNVAIAAIHAEDTALAVGETVDNAVRVTVGPGNTFAPDVPYHGALSGPQARIELAPGADGLERVFVRAAGDGHRGELLDSNGNQRTVAPGTIDHGIAAATAGSGVVTIENGTFDQDVLIDKDVTVRSLHFGGVPGHDGSRGTSDETVIASTTAATPNFATVRIAADGVTLDGVTISGGNNTAIGGGGNFTGVGSADVKIVNNRVIGLTGANVNGLYTNGPEPAASNWTVSNNLFSGISGSGASGINLWKASGGTISGNRVEDIAFGGIQVLAGSGVQVLGNALADIGRNGIQVTEAQGVRVRNNTVRNANNDGTSTVEGGISLGLASDDITVACNVIDGAGTNGISTVAQSLTGSTAASTNVRVFHNAVTTAVSISNDFADGAAIGSNWYGAGADAVLGGNTAGLLVADELAEDPTNAGAFDVGGCGSNIATAIAIHAGSSPQTTPIFTAFADLQVRLTDVLGGAAVGTPVTFEPPVSGALATLGAASGNTDYNGVHRTTATANGIAGAYLVPATSGALSVDFELANGKAVGTIELVQASFPYTGGDHVLEARIAEEPGTACTDTSPATISDVGPHDIAVGACTGTNYDAPAATLVATVTGEGSIRRLRDDVLFDSVADGLNDPETEDTDTLQMAPGVHSGPIVINRPITLVGDGDDFLNKAGVTPPGPGTVIDGGGVVADGVIVNPNVQNVSIIGLEVRNFARHCIISGTGAHGLLVQENLVHQCGGRGISVSGGGGIDNVTIDSNEVHTVGDRGIVVWDGIKRDITITNNWVHDLDFTLSPTSGCCGIELQDGTATGAWIIGNLVERTRDSGMSFIQLTSGSPSGRANIIRDNTITDTGRFGIEIKIPNGSGLDAGPAPDFLGDGAIVIEQNTIDGGGVEALRDRAGIAVHRRAYSPISYPMEVDATVGVIVRGNDVSGFRTADPVNSHQGFGIVVEGLGSTIEGNTLTDNDIGLQMQQANPSYPGDSDQNVVSDWFGRGNAPLTCVGLGDNTISASTVADSRTVPASADLVGGVRNEGTGIWYCSIQAAIDAATTVAGHTIRVYPGTYVENVTLGKGVTLVGPFAGTHGDAASRGAPGAEARIAPASGIALTISAANAVVDGLEFGPVTANRVVSLVNPPSTLAGVRFVNNRIVDFTSTASDGGAVFIAGNGTTSATDGMEIANNLFEDLLNGPPAHPTNGPFAMGVKVSRNIGMRIEDNVFRRVQSNAMQLSTITGAQVTGNTVEGGAPNFTNVGIQVTYGSGIHIDGNAFSGALQGFLFNLNSGNDVSFTCNVVADGTYGVRAAVFGTTGPAQAPRVFDNVLLAATPIANQFPSPAELHFGSNYYGGGTGSYTGMVLVADPLPRDPVDDPDASYVANCGNNIPVDLVLHGGSPQPAAQLNQPFTQPLQARVIDQMGGAVMGESVNFTAPVSGASAALSAPTPASGESDYNGVVEVSATANGFAGTYDVTAAWTTETVEFALTNQALQQVQLDLNGPVGGAQVGETVAYTGLVTNDNDDVTENVYLTIDVAGSTLDAIPAPMVLTESDVSLCVVNPGNPAQCLPIDFAVVGNSLHAEFPGDLVGQPIGTSFSIPSPYAFLHNLRVIYGRPGVYTATAQVVGVTLPGTVYASDMISTEVIEQHAGVVIDIEGPVTGVEKDVATDYALSLVNTAADVADDVFVDLVFTRDGGAWSPGDISVEQVGSGTLVLSPSGPNVLTAVLEPGAIALDEGAVIEELLRITHGVADTFHIAATVRDVAGDTDGIDPYAADSHTVEVIAPDPDVSLTLSGVFDATDGETLVAANVAEPVILRAELVNTGGDVAGTVRASFTIAAGDIDGAGDIDLADGDIVASYWFMPIGDVCGETPAAGLESVSFGDDGTTLSAATTPQPLTEGMELAVCFELAFARAGVYNIGAVIEDSVDDQITYAADNLAVTVADSDGVVTLTIPAASTFDGASRAATVDTNPPGLDYTLTYTYTGDGSVTGESDPPRQAGTYVVTATVDAGQGYTGSASGTLTITRKPVAILLGGDVGTFIYDGTSRIATATANPADLELPGFPFGAPLTVTYNGGAGPATTAGVYVLTATFDAGLVRNYVALPPVGSIVILPATGTVNFAPLSGAFGTAHSVVASLAQVDTNAFCDPVTGVPSASAPAGNYTVTSNCVSDNHVASGSATYVVTASTAAIVAVDAATVGVVTVDPLPDADAKKSYSTWQTTGAVGEPVRASFVVQASGDAQAGDLVIEYEESMSPGTWINLPLSFDAATDQWTGWFGAPAGFPFTHGAQSNFRSTFARGGRYTTTSRIVGASSGLVYATSAAVPTDVAQLELAGSGNTAGVVGEAVETGFALVNSGTAALSSGALFPTVPVPAQPAPNDENVRGRFTIVPPVGVMLEPADTSGPGGNCGDASCASPDVSVEFFDTVLGQYRPIHNLRAELDGLGAPTGALYGHFGSVANAGVPVPAGYSGSYLFRTTFRDDTGSYTVRAQVVGLDTGTVYAQAAPQTIGIDTGEAASIVIVGAASGTAVVGGNAHDINGDGSLRVLVLDSGDNPVEGATVVFNVPSSGATAVLSAADCSTGVNGECFVTATSGDFAGNFTVEASTGNVTPVGFALTNEADTDPTQIVLHAIAGAPQTAPANQPFGVALTVRVEDRFGNVLDGETVTFAAPPATGASADLSAVTADSGTDGTASITATANSILGGYSVTASIGSGPDGTAVFALQNTQATAVSIAATPGYDADATILTAYGTELEACVTDAGGDPVESVSVTFVAPASGASVVFADDTAGNGAVVKVTGTDGCARSGAVSANGVAGDVDEVTAVASGVGGPISAGYALENLVGAADALVIVGGNDQSVVVGSSFADLQVRLVDAGGNPIEAASVAFVATPAGNGASATGILTPAATDAAGLASTPATANAIAGDYIVTASSAGVDPVVFDLSNSVGALAITSIRWSGNDLASIAYSGAAQAVTFDTDPPVDADENCDLSYNGGGDLPTNAGVYLVQVVCSTDGLSGAASAVLTIVPDAVDVTLGDLAHVFDGSAKAASIATDPAAVTGVALAYSQGGSPVAAPVAAGVYDIAVSLSNANYVLGTVTPSPAQLTIAAASATIAFGASGPFVYTGQPQGPAVDSGGVAVEVLYTGTTAAGVPYGPSTTPPSAAGDYSVTATVTDPNYSASPAAQDFSIAKAQAQVTLSNLIHVFDGTVKAALATTTPAGLAVNLVYDPATPQAVGSYDVTGTVDDANYQGSASALLTILSAAISGIEADSDTAVTGIAGAPLATADLPTVRVLDNNGNGVEGISVLFEPGADSGSATGTTATTDSDGRATVGSWTLDADAGSDDTMTARVPGQAGLAVILFEATGSEEADVSVTKVSATTSADRGDALTYTITVGNSGPSNAGSVDVLDALPDGLDAATATWICLPTGEALCSEADGNGDVEVGAFVPVGDSVVITLSANVAASAPDGELINTAAVELTSGGIDGNDGNDSSSHAVTVVPRVPAIFADGFESADEEPAPAAAADAKAGPDVLAWNPDWSSLGQRPGVLLDVRGQGKRVAALDGLSVGERSFIRIRQRGADGREGFGAWIAVDKAASLRFAWTLALDGAELHFGQGRDVALALGLAPGQPLPARLRVLRAEHAGTW